MKATVIVDNNAHEGVNGEWGLSILIEYNGRSILLDAGASSLYEDNAKKLGLDLDRVSISVLSHAHYDHANGMEYFLTNHPEARLFLQSACAENCYAKKSDIMEYIGIPRGFLRHYSAQLVFVSGVCEILKGVWLVPHNTPALDQLGRRENMFIQDPNRPDCWMPDSFQHEQSLVFEVPQGLVIFNSCSHGGAGNIIKEVSDALPGKAICALVGGFHLYNKTESEIRSFANAIDESDVKYIYTGHCTGDPAFAILKKMLGSKVRQFHVGLVMEF